MLDLKKLHQEVMDILDQTAVRGKAGYDATARLREIPNAWKSAGGDTETLALLAQAQGVVGMLNSSDDNDPLRNDARRELLEFKRVWRAVADKIP